MKKTGILNESMLKAMGSMGHGDHLVVCDAGLPISKSVERIDLSVTRGIPRFVDVLKPLLDELVVEKVIIAAEMKAKSPEMYAAIKNLAGAIHVQEVSHEEFKKLSDKSKAIIRTGECTPYTNVILQTGVNF